MADQIDNIPGSSVRRTPLAQPEFLPMSRAEMERLGWGELDVLLVSGDAYVDHPSFGVALLGRHLVAKGYRVGIVAQPRWTSTEDFVCMGRPRLFAGATAGALDSMLAHYTAFRKKRTDDAYTPGGLAGRRPNRACVVYANLLKQAFPGLPIVLGGIEASLRRLSHYDFWTDKLRRSILLDAKADLILYGMAEPGILATARFLEDQQGSPPADKACPHGWTWPATIPGAVFIGDENLIAQCEPSNADDRDGREIRNPKSEIRNAIRLPSHEDILADPRQLMTLSLAVEQQVHHAQACAIQGVEGRTIIVTPPRGLSTAELDEIYSLGYSRRPHPSYRQAIPATEMIAWSITTHRGCGGGCSFCTLAAHQGRAIRSRSAGSILAEAGSLAGRAAFAGSVSDVGGPSANMWGALCAGDVSRCRRSSCLFPEICPKFAVDQMRIVELLRQVLAAPGVKHVRVASGIRHDLALKDLDYLRAVIREFVGGQLKVAPEHLCDRVLGLMRKPGAKVFERFLEIFEQTCREAGKPQYVIPYLISAFPGCTMEHMRELGRYLQRRGWQVQQAQCFIPLPGTTAAAMYYAGIDESGHPIPVARSDADRMAMHYALVGSPQAHGAGRGAARRGPPGRRK